ncbi:phosphoribosylanthranilate isomerase [Oribacterium sp. KHPX15]|uniref:phosphoribosylanthranilate isomerase n=1 Tax=Oribacterium sp. KHPX15 TaxID=1855342 RepID=UPI00089496FD|nr:phosphoribosylanthranilate isomerase [Oribacterium sp. KHPX15]SDZ80260.1 phosphoribosylanthranilate isomerase [Oribacterium sp. KHPX15]
MTKIKICGLRRPEDIETVNKYHPEYVGFVFYKKSKRYVTEEEAEKLRALLDEKIISVGVFVNADKAEILRLMRKGIITVAQLHGNESEDYIRELKEELSKPGKFPEEKEYRTDGEIIKAFVFKCPEAVSEIISRTSEILKEAEMSSADYILFDNGYGSGEAFDWSILRDFKKPYFLAGGLNPENVSEAIEKLKPYAVDVSSGVETDGFKDAEKIRAFIDNVRKH